MNNVRGIVLNSFGNWWLAVCRSFAIMSGSVYPAETVERRLGGEPVYIGGDSDNQDEITVSNPDEWKQQGGARIVASKIMRHAEKITGADWSAVTLGLHDDPIDRGLACAGLAKRIASETDLNIRYVYAVCQRWGESKYMQRYTGALSREYRIEYTHTIAELITLSHKNRNAEREDRSNISVMMNDIFSCARERLEDR